METLKNLLVIVFFWCGFLAMTFSSFARPWVSNSAPYETWSSVASSADGRKLVMAAIGPGPDGGIFTSTNFGSSWTSNDLPSSAWYLAASSADGTRLVTANDSGEIYISTNSGAVWMLATNYLAPYHFVTAIVSSADGSKLIVAYLVGVFRSVDSGTTWVSNSVTTNNLHWLFLASSADATKVVAADNFGYIYASTNSGAEWTQTSAPLENWQSIASSADGNKLVATAQGSSAWSAGPVYTSTNAGLTWISNDVPNQQWTSVSLSADGSIFVAVAAATSIGATIFISTNSGETWVMDALSNQFNNQLGCIASSADGASLIAVADSHGTYYGTMVLTPGFAYSSHIILPPQLNIAPANGNLTVSWIVPSTNFAMQQSSDLISWSDVTNSPVLNLTNLQDEVILSPPYGNLFYRLKTP